MFGYRRNAFKKAVALLSAIRHDPRDLQALLGLQDLLISEIVLAEGRIREYRERATVENDGRPEYYHTRLQSLRKTIYYWKMFGDAIAFLYVDRLALKHVFYNTHNMNPKQSSGFISGSVGFSRETEILNSLIKCGCPCILTDLTNTIRYGDICLLDAPDPYLIEVKSSRTKDRRRNRQRDKLQELGEFYQTDSLAGLRGFPIVHRVATHTKYVVHCEEFNKCIYHAYDGGHAIVSPEEGVYYIAIVETKTSIMDIFQQVQPNSPWVIYLNSMKSDENWAPYSPFTLLIESGSALYDFLLGRLHLIVLLDTAVMEKRIVEMGYSPRVNMEDEYPVRIQMAGAQDEVRIARHLLLRAALEALSLKWILRSAIAGFEIVSTSPNFPVGIGAFTDSIRHKLDFLAE